jgi:hypothetical protein
MAALRGLPPGEVGTTRFRPPFVPLPFGTIAAEDAGGKPPKDRGELLQGFVGSERVLGRIPDKRLRETAEECFHCLGWKMQQVGRLTTDRKTVYDALEEARDRSSADLDVLRDHLQAAGLLIDLGRRQYKLVHQLIQEYAAAAYLLNTGQTAAKIPELARDEFWRETCIAALWLDKALHTADYLLSIMGDPHIDLRVRVAAATILCEVGERRNVRGIDAFGTYFFSFNCLPTLPGDRPNPFRDPRVRRAFALAVDKQTLIDRVTRLGERVASTLVPHDSILGYPRVDGLGYDPARARAELKAAGWEDRDGDGVVENEAGVRFPTVDILYSSSNPRYQNLALAMRDMWKRELRVAAECRSKDPKLYKDDLKRGNFMIARGGWYGDYGDPMTWLDLQQSQNGNNDRGYANAEFDRRLAEADAELDPATRLTRLAELEHWLFNEEVPLLPMCTYVTVYGYDPTRTMGITEHPRLPQDLSVIGPRHREAEP